MYPGTWMFTPTCGTLSNSGSSFKFIQNYINLKVLDGQVITESHFPLGAGLRTKLDFGSAVLGTAFASM
jgi:hypothetical protein